MTHVLTISAYYRDSAAALLRDGVLVAAAQEERFSRKKHDASFAAEAIRYCLSEGGLKLDDLDYVVFYDKPLTKFERLVETCFAYAPKGLRSFLTAMPIWLKEKLYLKSVLRKELSALGCGNESACPPLLFTPVSLLMKLIRWDPRSREFDQTLESYRKASHKASRESLERPF